MKKSLLILASAAVLAVVVIVIEKPFGSETGDFKPAKPFAKLNIDSVSDISIEYLISGVEIKKETDNWQFKGVKTDMAKQVVNQDINVEDVFVDADGTKVSDLINNVKDMVLEEVASDNRENQGLYQVNTTGRRVVMKDAAGNTLAEFYIGKVAPKAGKVYFRKEGDDNVYLTSGSVVGLINPNINYWKPSEEVAK